MTLPSLLSPIQARSASSLQRRFIIAAGVAGTLIVLTLAVAANSLLQADAQRQGDARVSDAARRGQIVVAEALGERSREARVLALSPEVVSATREGRAKAQSLGVTGLDIAALEQRFKDTRSLEVAPATKSYLRSLLPQLDGAEMLLTDANGFNSVITERSSDFVQSDESWWQSAWRDGLSSADASFDSSAHQTVVSLAALVRDGDIKSGVLKLAFSVSPLVRSLNAAGAGVHIDVLDSADQIVISSDSISTGRTIRGMPNARDDNLKAINTFADSAAERAVMLRTNSGRWRVVAHLPLLDIAAPFRTTRTVLFIVTGVLFGVLIALLFAMNGFLRRRISAPATALAEAAEAVAAGDFSVELERSATDDEIGRLSRAVGAMIVELRRLAKEIATSARDTQDRSVEITAGSEQMAAAASQIATTSSDLSSQATSMAETIASLAETSGSLRSMATSLETGARDGVARNVVLRALATDNRSGLDASTESLAQLAEDVDASAQAINTLGSASEEIREFVTLVRKLARQSKLLALNAAMEAARAGEHGKGFAVVATEVRRLATMSSEAAERTDTIVKTVLAGIDRSRQSSERAVRTASEVHTATARASASFSEIERAVEQSEQWTSTIERVSAGTSALVSEINQRLDELAGGTQTFAAAMQQVAASSEQQSATTQEIAAAANTLNASADRLSHLSAGWITKS